MQPRAVQGITLTDHANKLSTALELLIGVVAGPALAATVASKPTCLIPVAATMKVIDNLAGSVKALTDATGRMEQYFQDRLILDDDERKKKRGAAAAATKKSRAAAAAAAPSEEEEEEAMDEEEEEEERRRPSNRKRRASKSANESSEGEEDEEYEDPPGQEELGTEEDDEPEYPARAAAAASSSVPKKTSIYINPVSEGRKKKYRAFLRENPGIKIDDAVALFIEETPGLAPFRDVVHKTLADIRKALKRPPKEDFDTFIPTVEQLDELRKFGSTKARKRDWLAEFNKASNLNVGDTLASALLAISNGRTTEEAIQLRAAAVANTQARKLQASRSHDPRVPYLDQDTIAENDVAIKKERINNPKIFRSVTRVYDRPPRTTDPHPLRRNASHTVEVTFSFLASKWDTNFQKAALQNEIDDAFAAWEADHPYYIHRWNTAVDDDDAKSYLFQNPHAGTKPSDVLRPGAVTASYMPTIKLPVGPRNTVKSVRADTPIDGQELVSVTTVEVAKRSKKGEFDYADDPNESVLESNNNKRRPPKRAKPSAPAAPAAAAASSSSSFRAAAAAAAAADDVGDPDFFYELAFYPAGKHIHQDALESDTIKVNIPTTLGLEGAAKAFAKWESTHSDTFRSRPGDIEGREFAVKLRETFIKKYEDMVKGFVLYADAKAKKAIAEWYKAAHSASEKPPPFNWNAEVLNGDLFPKNASRIPKDAEVVVVSSDEEEEEEEVIAPPVRGDHDLAITYTSPDGNKILKFMTVQPKPGFVLKDASRGPGTIFNVIIAVGKAWLPAQQDAQFTQWLKSNPKWMQAESQFPEVSIGWDPRNPLGYVINVHTLEVRKWIPDPVEKAAPAAAAAAAGAGAGDDDDVQMSTNGRMRVYGFYPRPRR